MPNHHNKPTRKVADPDFKAGDRVAKTDGTPLVGTVVRVHKHPDHVAPFVEVELDGGGEVDWLKTMVRKVEAE